MRVCDDVEIELSSENESRNESDSAVLSSTDMVSLTAFPVQATLTFN